MHHLLSSGAICLTLCLVAAPVTGQPAASFRNGPAHLGVYEGPAVHRFTHVQWHLATDGAIRSTPAVAEGILYVGSTDGHLYALDAQTGEERWRFRSDDGVTSSPAVTSGRVYFTSRDRHLYALDARTGAVTWAFEMGADLPYTWDFDYYTSSPTVVNGTLYVGGGDGYVYALDAQSGTERWRFQTPGRVRSSPAVVSGVVYVGDVEGYVYALDAETGTQRWRFATVGAPIDPTPYGFDHKAVIASPAVSEGLVVVGGRDGFLYAIEAATGRERWRFDYANSWIISSVAIANGQVFTGTSDGQFVHALDLQTGEERWRLSTAGGVWSSPAYVDELLYFGSAGGVFYAVDAATGAERWRFRAFEGFHGSPVVHDGLIYVGGNNGVVYALAGSTAPQADHTAPHKVVFWDEDPSFSWFQHGAALSLRTMFEMAGYEVLDEAALAPFLRDRLADRAPSVVVFLAHKLPQSVAQDTSASALIRRYLDAAGKVVWLGLAPPAYARNAEGQVTHLDFSIPERIFDIRYGGPDTRGVGGIYTTRLTADGVRWGLTGDWMVGRGSVDPASVSSVLALNEVGMAVAWVKNYGGPEGTGLVQLLLNGTTPGPIQDVLNVIEHGL